MRTRIITITIVFYLIAFSLCLLSKYLQHRNQKALIGSEQYSFDSLQSIFDSLTACLSCALTYGKSWNYDPKQNVVHIPRQDQYSLFDKFVLLHEAGHASDSKTKYRVLYRIDYPVRIINILSYFPVTLIFIIQLCNQNSRGIFTLQIVSFVLLASMIAESSITIWMESSASRWAVAHVNAGKYEKVLRGSAFMALTDQLLIRMMWAFPLLEIVSCS